MNIENLVEEGLSTRQIAKKMNKSQGFVKYNLKTWTENETYILEISNY